MNTKIFNILSIIFTLCLFSCRSSHVSTEEMTSVDSTTPDNAQTTTPIDETSQPISTQTPKTSPTKTITLLTPTDTLSVQTRTPSLIETATDAARFEVQKHCVQIQSVLDRPPSGKLVLNNDFQVSLLDVDIEAEEVIFGKSDTYPVIAPTGDKLAFINREDKQLQVFDQNGSLLLLRSVPESWWSVIAWVSETQLIVEKFSGSTEIPLSDSVLYDFETEIITPLPYKWPDMYSFGAVPDWSHGSRTATSFNKQLSHLIYLAEFPLVLYDLTQMKEITRIDGTHLVGAGEPQWSKDGESFITSLAPYGDWDPKSASETPDHLVYKGGTDLFRVHIDGEIERLTYLSVISEVLQDKATLSPHESYVAFWKNEHLEISFMGYGVLPVTRTLMIFDLQTNRVIDLCVDSETELAYSPIWSPDEKYIVVSVRSPLTEDQQVFIINLETFTGVYLDSQSVPTGWIND